MIFTPQQEKRFLRAIVWSAVGSLVVWTAIVAGVVVWLS